MFIKDDENAIENLKTFIKKWTGMYSIEYGLSKEEVPCDLPKALREIYFFAGNWPHQRNNDDKYFMKGKQPRLFQEQDILCGINELERKDNRVTFLYENQDNWSCEAELNNDNSKVFCDAAAVYDDNVSGHEIVCSSLTHFLVTFCLQELTFSSKYMGPIKTNSEKELVKGVLQPLWLDGYYVDKEPTHSFYTCNDELMIMDMPSGYFYACNKESGLDLLFDKNLCGRFGM